MTLLEACNDCGIKPSTLELAWREFRSSIKTEIPTVNFSWEEAVIYKSNRYNKSILPVCATQQEQTLNQPIQNDI